MKDSTPRRGKRRFKKPRLTDAQKKIAGRLAFSIFAAFFLCASALAVRYSQPPPLETASEAELDAEVCFAMTASTQTSGSAGVEEPPIPAPADNTITLSFVGDCMLATMLGSTAPNTFNYLADTLDPSYFFAGCADYFLTDDFTVANCENVFTDDESLTPTYKNYSPAYWYRSKTENAGIFKTGGVDIVSIANNHSNDYGAQGYEDTVAALEKYGVEWGDNSKTVVVEKCGKKIALLLVTYYYQGAEAAIINQMNAVRDEVDYIIVYYHGGTERVYEPDSWRISGSRNLIDAGADLVIGGHPHVLQPIEEYNGKYIVNSLGNFLFGGSTKPENRTVILQFVITVASDGSTVEELRLIPYYCYSEPWQPAKIEDEAAAQKVVDFMWGLEDSPL